MDRWMDGWMDKLIDRFCHILQWCPVVPSILLGEIWEKEWAKKNLYQNAAISGRTSTAHLYLQADCFPTRRKAHIQLLHNCGHVSVLHHWYVNHLAAGSVAKTCAVEWFGSKVKAQVTAEFGYVCYYPIPIKPTLQCLSLTHTVIPCNTHLHEEIELLQHTQVGNVTDARPMPIDIDGSYMLSGPCCRRPDLANIPEMKTYRHPALQAANQ